MNAILLDARGDVVEKRTVTPRRVRLTRAAVDRLAELDERKSRLVELRYFGGLGIDEAAGVLGVSPATVKREWITARAWLKRELSVA